MASSAVRSLLRQTAQEHDLLFPEGGLTVPDFLLKDRHGDLHSGWRSRFETIVSNEWAVTQRVFSERPYSTVVELRDQLRERLHDLSRSVTEADNHVRQLTLVSETIGTLKLKHDQHAHLHDVLGEATPRSNAGKIGWSYDSETKTYSLGLTSFAKEGDHSGDFRRIEFGRESSLDLVLERLREKQDWFDKKNQKTDRSHQICRFKLQVLDAMLWQYEMFGELPELTSSEIEQAAGMQEERQIRENSEGCNVPALRTAWEWMLRNRKRCWDNSGRPNKRAIWQAILLDPEHRDSLWLIDSQSVNAERISAGTADHYMNRFEVEVGPTRLQEFQCALGLS